MAERQVKVEFIGNAESLKGATDEATQAVQKLADEYENGAIDANKFVTEVGKISPELGRVAAAGKVAEDAVNRLDEAAAKGPRALTREITVSVASIERLKDSIEKARAAGAPVSANAEASVKALEQRLSEASVTARRTADALGDLKTRSDTSVKGFENLAGSSGSLDGMLAKLKDQATPTATAVANVGFAAVAVTASFKMGYDAGVKLRELYTELTGKQLPSLTNWFVQLAYGVENASGKFDHHGVAARSLVGRHNELKMAVTASVDALRAAIPTYDEALKKQEAQAAAIEVFRKSIATLLSKDGADLNKWMKTLGPAAAEWALSIVQDDDAMSKLTGTLRGHIIELARGADGVKKLREEKEKLTNAYEDVLKAVDKAIASAAKEKAAAEASADAARKTAEEKMKALREEDVSLEEFSRRKKEIYAEMDRQLEESSRKEQEAAEKDVEAHGKREEAWKKLNEGIKEYNITQERLKETTRVSSKEIEEQRVALDALTKSADAQVKALKQAGEHQLSFEAATRKARLEMDKQNETFHDADGKVHSLNASVKQLDSTFEMLGGV